MSFISSQPEIFYHISDINKYENQPATGNHTNTLALFNILEDQQTDLYELHHHSDLVSLICELGGIGFLLALLGRILTSFISRRLFQASVIHKTMQVKNLNRLPKPLLSKGEKKKKLGTPDIETPRDAQPWKYQIKVAEDGLKHIGGTRISPED